MQRSWVLAVAVFASGCVFRSHWVEDGPRTDTETPLVVIDGRVYVLLARQTHAHSHDGSFFHNPHEDGPRDSAPITRDRSKSLRAVDVRSGESVKLGKQRHLDLGKGDAFDWMPVEVQALGAARNWTDADLGHVCWNTSRLLDDRWIAVALTDGGGVALFDLRAGEARTAAIDGAARNCIEAHARGDKHALVLWEDDRDATLIWRVEPSAQRVAAQRIAGHVLDVSPSATRALFDEQDGRIAVKDVADGHVVASVDVERAHRAVLATDDDLLVLGTKGGFTISLATGARREVTLDRWPLDRPDQGQVRVLEGTGVVELAWEGWGRMLVDVTSGAARFFPQVDGERYQHEGFVAMNGEIYQTRDGVLHRVRRGDLADQIIQRPERWLLIGADPASKTLVLLEPAPVRELIAFRPADGALRSWPLVSPRR